MTAFFPPLILLRCILGQGRGALQYFARPPPVEVVCSTLLPFFSRIHFVSSLPLDVNGPASQFNVTRGADGTRVVAVQPRSSARLMEPAHETKSAVSTTRSPCYWPESQRILQTGMRKATQPRAPHTPQFVTAVLSSWPQTAQTRACISTMSVCARQAPGLVGTMLYPWGVCVRN